MILIKNFSHISRIRTHTNGYVDIDAIKKYVKQLVQKSLFLFILKHCLEGCKYKKL